MEHQIRAAYDRLRSYVDSAPDPRPQRWELTPLEDGVAAWLNFLSLAPLPSISSPVHRDDATRLDVMSRQLIALSLAADLVRDKPAPDLELSWAGPEVRCRVACQRESIVAVFRPVLDDGAPLGFWPLDLRFEGFDPVRRYVVPRIERSAGVTATLNALEAALARYYGPQSD